MKKLLFTLFVAAAVFTGCQKDAGTNVTIAPGDLTTVDAQLKGTWVFPVQTIKYQDATGASVLPTQNMTSPAFEFDGSKKVNILVDDQTTQKGTYSLTTNGGMIYLTVVYPDATSVKYQVLKMNSQSLKLVTTQPYTYYDNTGNPSNATAIATTELTRQSSAEVTANLIRVTAASDSAYSVSLYVSNNQSTTAENVLVNSIARIVGNFDYTFAAKSGDHLVVDVVGKVNATYFYAYYKGIPLSGQTTVQGNETTTNNGWDIP